MRRWLLLITPVPAALVLALVLLLARAGTGVAASAPSTIARGLPAGAVAYLETPDLRGLLTAWHDSRAAHALAGSAADQDMRRGMLWLRLGERLAGIEQLAGFELTYERARLLFGHEAGIAVYDLAGTRFVLATRLADAEITRTPLAQARKRFASRRHEGVEYFVHEQPGQPTLAFAFVADRLLVGNDLEHFHQALVLTALEAHVAVKVKPASAPPALAGEADYRGLVAASPGAASLRVYVRLDDLVGTHHFDDFWVFNWAAPGGMSARLDGVVASMLSLRLRDGGGGATETRVHLVDAAGGKRIAAWPTADRLPGAGAVGAVDVAAAGVATLPAGLIASVDEPDVARVAGRVLRLLPRVDGAPADPAALVTLLQAARPGRSLEIVSLDARLSRAGAIALRLADPGRLDAAALEAALRGSLTASLGARVKLDFTGSAGERTLVVPLVPAADWALTILTPRAGAPFLIIATSPTVARELAGALAARPLAHLLEDDAPLATRLDVATMTARWSSLAAALAPGPWPSTDGARFSGEVVPALLASSGLTTVAALAYRAGDYRVEQVDFLW